jgi:hypothetical protein
MISMMMEVRYSSEPIQKNVLGVSAGFEGKFNRKFSWAYGGEIGYRPGLKGSGLFAECKNFIPCIWHSAQVSGRKLW